MKNFLLPIPTNRHHGVRWICKIFITLLISLCVLQTSYDVQAQNIPEITSPVTDLAGVLSNSAESRISNSIIMHRSDTGVQIAVVTVRSLEGHPIEDYSIALAESWQGGSSTRDDGVILLISASDGQSRIEVGIGLEEYLLDSESREILESSILHFSRGDFDNGVMLAIESIISETKLELELEPNEDNKNAFYMIMIVTLGFTIVFSFFMLSSKS